SQTLGYFTSEEDGNTWTQLPVTFAAEAYKSVIVNQGAIYLLDTTYNYPRVWGLQKMFSPSIKNDVTKNTFPVYAKAEKPISI
ncbi:C69 family dipeptidase, partial [Prevotella intermedia]|uniref:C69 family dipeptidase n=1 Tax=Prevotella intermedia TaxID=28131 RepID=UPI002150F906